MLEDKELEVYATYAVELIKQASVGSATINELKYYYDTNYELCSIGYSQDNNGMAVNDVGITRELLEHDENLNKEVEKISINAEIEKVESIKTLYLTFRVKKDSRNLPREINSDNGLECANLVEITSYSTNDGLIDRDSEPDNLKKHWKDKLEDDEKCSNGLLIKIKKTSREISGKVFDDDTEDKKGVNDVIVQLIEIREKAHGDLGEFIWEETKTGGNEIRTSGGSNEAVTNMAGEYTFKGFIPGNYIIRFIYGDGTTYDLTPEKMKYNGQDYKSTKDLAYNEEWYNEAKYKENKYGNNSSVARDNEARRLEVMAYSTMIDSEKGCILDSFKKEYDKLTDWELEVLKEYYDMTQEEDKERNGLCQIKSWNICI